MPTTFTTWNIYRGMQLSRIIETLKNLNSDVIALQEVSFTSFQGQNVNAAEAIANALGYSWHYCRSVSVERESGAYELGNALLSRHPFLQKACEWLNDGEDYAQTVATEPRIACTAQIQVHDRLLTLISTHVFHPHHDEPGGATERQLARLMKLVTGNTVLMGDFNNEGTSAAMRVVEDSLRNAGSRSTDPTFVNIKYDKDEKRRFDHIYVSHPLPVISYAVTVSDASDHMPVTAVVEL